MEIKGVITHVMEPQSGTSANGEWTRQEWVLKTQEQYPKSIAFQAFNKHFDMKEGQSVNVHINIESKEHNGRWFTNVSAWKIDFDSAQQAPAPADEIPPATTGDPLETDDLPF